MRIAVVGGKLQGVEACYLAGKAGWETVLIERNPEAPATGLCHELRLGDITDEGSVASLLSGVSCIVPATENAATLAALTHAARIFGIPLAFDPPSYVVSSSKNLSNELFARLGVPMPRAFPGCGFPVVVKPSGASGSAGVRTARTPEALGAIPGFSEGGWVVQEYVSGPSYSLEVLGFPGGRRTLQVTECFVDGSHDCKRVASPSGLPPEAEGELRRVAETVAEALGLFGVMDIEAILAPDGGFRVLEIDARLPSQTPTVVWLSTGVNIVEALARIAMERREPPGLSSTNARGALYEHVKVEPGSLEVSGEHIMGGGGPLRQVSGFFGADEALTTFEPGRARWAATLMWTGEDRAAAFARREDTIRALRKTFGLAGYRDPAPVI